MTSSQLMPALLHYTTPTSYHSYIIIGFLRFAYCTLQAWGIDASNTKETSSMYCTIVELDILRPTFWHRSLFFLPRSMTLSATYTGIVYITQSRNNTKQAFAALCLTKYIPWRPAVLDFIVHVLLAPPTAYSLYSELSVEQPQMCFGRQHKHS